MQKNARCLGGQRAKVNRRFSKSRSRIFKLTHYPKLGKVLWVEITKAKPEQMRMSFMHHRNRILSECKQLSFDFDSYKENNPFGAKLPAIEFNFSPDIEEAKLPLQYV